MLRAPQAPTSSRVFQKLSLVNWGPLSEINFFHGPYYWKTCSINSFPVSLAITSFVVGMNMAIFENLSTMFSSVFFLSTSGRSVMKSAVITSHSQFGISVGTSCTGFALVNVFVV